ncbi:MAG TPA: uroporphyrinogen decarboxylase [Woeseiaceae bacterium]|nr:uroporphyrinogen decarboxylase [Woeseiaceae bacterium]
MHRDPPAVAPLDNDLLLRALLREPVPRTPVWIMRQAGRYLPEYRATREQAGDFMSLCRNPELACEVTLQPLRRFSLDAAILFSDILTVPDAMGLELYFETGEGPKFRRPLRSARDIRNLPAPDVADALGYVFDAVRTIRRALAGRVPLIGFAGSPWTVATYMVEGGSDREFRRIRALAAGDRKSLERLLAHVARTTTDYLNAQIEAGAQAVQVFDTWGGVLGRDDYRRYSLAYMERIVDGLIREREGRRVPVILFTKGAGPLLADMAKSGCDALGVDWETDLATAREYVADRVALQGNLDPAALRRSPEAIRDGVAAVLESYGKGPGHVFNLGHGITPDIDPGHLGACIQAVHDLSPQYHL